MEGRLTYFNVKDKYGKVDTRNNEYGILTIYFQRIPTDVHVDCTVEFDIVTSRITGKPYAKFLSVVDRNQVVFNTEDRELWYIWGEDFEADFIERVVPRINIDIRKNPEKVIRPWLIDLYDYTNGKPADLKTQNTPFFTAGKYMYNGQPYNPQYTVTFNKKDYENYLRNYPDCDIYFWVHWTQLSYKGYRVQDMYGVWRTSFSRMVEKIQNNEVVLHEYLHRKDDDHNAKDSYLFNLADQTVFERLL